MEFQATSKYIRTSTRKLRLVADAIRKLSPEVAVYTLSRMPKRAAEPMEKVLTSAITNAKASNVDVQQLTIKTIEVMGGPVMKRWMAVSRGQGHAYKKRMTHVRIILSQKEINKVVKKEVVKETVKETKKAVKNTKTLPVGGNNGTKS
jgi:large subunit ribosomal protein L22